MTALATPARDATGAPAGPERTSARLRRWWWPLTVLAGLLLVAALSLLVNRPPSSLPLAPDNPRPDGARAAAQILQREGVQIELRRTLSAALADTPADGTMLVTHPALLSDDQWAALAETRFDLVLTNVVFADLGALTTAVETTGLGGSAVRSAPRCSDEDAMTAGSLSTRAGDVRVVGPDAVVCFPSPDAGPADVGEVGAFAVIRDGERRVAILADGHPLTNEGLDEAGNAALVLRTLGARERLTWYMPSPADTTGGVGDAGVLPPGSQVVAYWALLVAAAAALWRGRRLGPVVVEPLPVLVPPAETTRGRARLYRRARAHGHAASALRAGAATRLAHRIGVPDSAGPAALTEAVASATGRPPAEIRHLLYGPAPDDDEALLALVRSLDALEREVRP